MLSGIKHLWQDPISGTQNLWKFGHPDVNYRLNGTGDSKLIIYISRNNLQKVREILAAGADPNLLGCGYTPLYWACFSNVNPQIVDALFNAGANVNQDVGDGTLPLHFAALMGRTAIATRLVTQGAQVDAPLFGKTPLMIAIIGGHYQTALELLRLGANPAYTHLGVGSPLKLALKDPAIKPKMILVVKALLNDPRVAASRETGRLLASAGVLPLWFAVRSNDEELVARMLSYREVQASINFRDATRFMQRFREGYGTPAIRDRFMQLDVMRAAVQGLQRDLRAQARVQSAQAQVVQNNDEAAPRLATFRARRGR